MKNAITLIKLMVQGEEDIRSGRLDDQDKVFPRIEARLIARRERAANLEDLLPERLSKA
jgi:hypothetical protein